MYKKAGFVLFVKSRVAVALCVLLRERRDEVPPELLLLPPVGERGHGAEAVHDVAGLAEVDLVKGVPG